MSSLSHLFANNKAWAERISRQNPDFFPTLSKQQTPEYLWIGCADSRVPANEIVGLMPGELFVHRNIANVVVHSDLNCLSVLQFAVDVLKVRHVIVCGHYGCGGVRAALDHMRIGLADNWLHHVEDVLQKHTKLIAAIEDRNAAADRLCELNVISQVENVCRTTIVNDAWKRGQELAIHGWVYGLKDGIAHDLKVTVSNGKDAPEICRAGIAALA